MNDILGPEHRFIKDRLGKRTDWLTFELSAIHDGLSKAEQTVRLDKMEGNEIETVKEC